MRWKARLGLEAFRESVIAVAERVNRKVQVLSLHWQASMIKDQMNAVYQHLGTRLCDVLAQVEDFPHRLSTSVGNEAQAILSEAEGRLQWLKRELDQVDQVIRDLENDTLRDDLLKIQQDLSSRSAGMARAVVAQGSAAQGCSVNRLDLPPSIRIAAVLRGPVLLSSVDEVVLRAGDILILLGPRHDLRRVLPVVTEKQRLFA